MDWSIIGILSKSGPTLYILLLCSLVSWVLILERGLYFKSNRLSPQKALEKFLDKRNKESLTDHLIPIYYVLEVCQKKVANIKDTLTINHTFEEVKSRAISEKLLEMQKFLNVQASLASVSPYIGLLGTVFGIIHAFMGISQSDLGLKSKGLYAGIAEALVATAGGLIVAIPASLAYNYFQKELQNMILEIEIASSKLKEHILKSKVKKRK